MGQNQGKLTKIEKKEMKRLKKQKKLNKEKLNNKVKGSKMKKKEKNKKNHIEVFENDNAKTDLDMNSETGHGVGYYEEFANNLEPNTLGEENGEDSSYPVTSTLKADENGARMIFEANVLKNQGQMTSDKVIEGEKDIDEKGTYLPTSTEIMTTEGEDVHQQIADVDLHQENESSDTDDDTVACSEEGPDVESIMGGSVQRERQDMVEKTLFHDSMNGQNIHTNDSDKTIEMHSTKSERSTCSIKGPTSTEILRNSYFNKLPELYKLEMQEKLTRQAVPLWYRRSQEAWKSQDQPEVWKTKRDHPIGVNSSNKLKSDDKSMKQKRDVYEMDRGVHGSGLSRISGKVVFNVDGKVQNTGKSCSESMSEDISDDHMSDTQDVMVIKDKKENASRVNYIKAKEMDANRSLESRALDSRPADLNTKTKHLKDTRRLEEGYDGSKRRYLDNRDRERDYVKDSRRIEAGHDKANKKEPRNRVRERHYKSTQKRPGRHTLDQGDSIKAYFLYIFLNLKPIPLQFLLRS